MDLKSLNLVVCAALMWTVNVSALHNSPNAASLERSSNWHGYQYHDPQGVSSSQFVFYQPSQSSGHPQSPWEYGNMQKVSSSPSVNGESWTVDESPQPTVNPTPSAPKNNQRRNSRFPLAPHSIFSNSINTQYYQIRWPPASAIIK